MTTVSTELYTTLNGVYFKMPLVDPWDSNSTASSGFLSAGGPTAFGSSTTFLKSSLPSQRVSTNRSLTSSASIEHSIFTSRSFNSTYRPSTGTGNRSSNVSMITSIHARTPMRARANPIPIRGRDLSQNITTQANGSGPANARVVTSGTHTL